MLLDISLHWSFILQRPIIVKNIAATRILQGAGGGGGGGGGCGGGGGGGGCGQ